MATTYRFKGSKRQGDNTERLILEGSVEDPKRFVDRGGTVELSDDEVTELRASKYEFVKVSDEQAESDSGEQEPVKGQDQAGTSQNPSGLPAKEQKTATGASKAQS